ncbi:hypothetical protein ACLOJK_019488 [Asimina triloba]
MRISFSLLIFLMMLRRPISQPRQQIKHMLCSQNVMKIAEKTASFTSVADCLSCNTRTWGRILDLEGRHSGSLTLGNEGRKIIDLGEGMPELQHSIRF